MATFGAIGARLKIGTLEIGGEARNFGITAQGEFKAGAANPDLPFAVVLSAGGTSGAALGWPSWLPIQINTLGVEFGTTPDGGLILDDFTLVLSASVSGLPAVAGLERPVQDKLGPDT